jgi:DNA-binding transcriptional MerR regulator/effector-binding domain-containing protein
VFRIGDFARIARVSGRQLRHYDRLGLLEPSHTDRQTGYRYYSADQLPRLNRLLALKALGFSLTQIGRMLSDEVATDELRGMLSMRKAQVEQSLAEEQSKLRQIESRIQQIEEQGSLRDYDVTLKREAARDFLAARQTFADMDEVVRMLRLAVARGKSQLRSSVREKLVVVAHSDFDDEGLDLEIGFTLTKPVNTRIDLAHDVTMAIRELEAVDTIASVVRAGPSHQTHLAYGALGIWMEANDYEIAGPCREVFLELPFADPADDHVVMEIQFPVTKAA